MSKQYTVNSKQFPKQDSQLSAVYCQLLTELI
jgi:hypothetical protein